MRKVVVWLLTAAMVIAFVPSLSFAAEQDTEDGPFISYIKSVTYEPGECVFDEFTHGYSMDDGSFEYSFINPSSISPSIPESATEEYESLLLLDWCGGKLIIEMTDGTIKEYTKDDGEEWYAFVERQETRLLPYSDYYDGTTWTLDVQFETGVNWGPGEHVFNGRFIEKAGNQLLDNWHTIATYPFTVNVTINETSHNLVKQNAVAPTCEASGNNEYWYCTKCGKFFSDAEGTAEIEENSWIIPAGHKKGEHITSPAGYLKNGYDYYVCSVCGKQLDYTVVLGTATNFVKKMKVSKGKKAITVKWKKQNKKNQKLFNGYEIEVATDPNFTNIVATAKAGKKAKSKKIKGLQKKTVYYVHMRSCTVSEGVPYYSPWTMRPVKTK